MQAVLVYGAMNTEIAAAAEARGCSHGSALTLSSA